MQNPSGLNIYRLKNDFLDRIGLKVIFLIE